MGVSRQAPRLSPISTFKPSKFQLPPHTCSCRCEDSVSGCTPLSDKRTPPLCALGCAVGGSSPHDPHEREKPGSRLLLRIALYNKVWPWTLTTMEASPPQICRTTPQVDRQLQEGGQTTQAYPGVSWAGLPLSDEETGCS